MKVFADIPEDLSAGFTGATVTIDFDGMEITNNSKERIVMRLDIEKLIGNWLGVACNVTFEDDDHGYEPEGE